MKSLFGISALFCIALSLMMFSSSVGAQTFADCIHYDSSCSSGVCACQHGGVCVAPGFTTCTCNTNTTFYAGFYCETPKCFGISPKECNTGTCIGANVCNCSTPGWEGEDCSIPICDDYCVHGNCTGPNTCTCEFGYAGALCNVTEDECQRSYRPCDNLTTCTNLTPDNGGYRCSPCPGNYTGSPYIFYNTTQNGTNFVVRGGCVPIGATSTLPSSELPSNAVSSTTSTSSSASTAPSATNSTRTTGSTSTSGSTTLGSTTSGSTTSGSTTSGSTTSGSTTSKTNSTSGSTSGTSSTGTTSPNTVAVGSSSLMAASLMMSASLILFV